ncbi:PASTA domain-containing protein [Streptomyces sp. NPDC046931]|uniref:PASTA domain-containing protein n=1 Tax=Streptomyces sp. NPDC046931 TaxID=3154806 RepID=UPI0033E0F3FB
MSRRTLACTAAVIAILAAGTACQPTKTTGSSGSTATATATATTSSSDSTTAAPKAVPNFVGMGLQSAQDTAQSAGFYTLKSHDALGRGRHQILDRDWKVCSQNVKAGSSASTDTELDFGAVKLAETCPAHDQAPPSAAGGTMPDFHGKSVKVARDALDSSTSITVKDVSGQDRMVLVESNWQVCSQKPAAGAKLAGQPVELDAVKFGENCP